MNREKRINDEVNKTLERLDKIEAVEANPYFYSQLLYKIEKLPGEGLRRPRVFDLFSRPLLRPAFLVLLMLLNLISAMFFFLGDEKKSAVDRSVYISAVADMYSLSSQSSDSYFPNSSR